MAGGGGGGDGGAQKMEDQRQARVNSAINVINSIFDGSPTVRGAGQANTFDPNQTYYNADGTAYTAPTVSLSAGRWMGTGGDAGDARWEQDPAVGTFDMDQINEALRGGQLYTGVERTAGQDRSGLYEQQRQAVTDLNRRDVDRQFLDAERQNRFGLARAGLSGGSADIDSNADLTRRTNEGLMKAAGVGDQAAADLQTSDERSRQNMISMAQSGIDTGQAAQMALSQLDANSANAQSARSGATVGNLFGDLAQAYLYGQQQQGARAGAAPYQQWTPGSNSSTRTGYSGSTSS